MGKYLLPGIVGTVGIVAAVLAVIGGWVIVPNIIEDKINEEVSLKPGTETWDKWLANPVPVYLDFYIFNVSNPREVELGEKPELKEFGPYSYRQERQKYDIMINEAADTVSYKQNITYFFDEARSGDGLKETDQYSVINAPFIILSDAIWQSLKEGGASVVHTLNGMGENIVNYRNGGPMVADILFNGWPLHSIYPYIFEMGRIPVPPEYADCLTCEFRFGFYKNKNNTNDGVYTVNAGIKDSSKFGQILAWNGKPELDWWYPPSWLVPERPNKTYCNMINGTDGSIYQPFIKKDTVLYSFSSDACRSTQLVYKNDMEFKGIKGYKFGFPDTFYLPGEENANNYCFCPTPPTGLAEKCLGGVSRIFPCKGRSPTATSSPHFLGANADYLTHVNGLKPEAHLHETAINLEPNSGLMLQITKKVQINMEVQAFPTYLKYANLTNFMFPAFWANENVEQNDYYANDLKSKLLNPLKLTDIFKWTILGIGVALIAGAGVLLIMRR